MIGFEFEHFVDGDENLVATLLEEWSLPTGSASDQIQGAAGQSDLNSNGFLSTGVPAILSQRTSQSQRLAPSFLEGPSPTFSCRSGNDSDNPLQGADGQFGAGAPSLSRGFNDLNTHEFLASANPPQEIMNRRRKTEQGINKRHRGSNWGIEETTCFLKHMETVVVAEKHKPPWKVVSEAMKRVGFDRSEKATENRWGVLLAALKTDSHNESITSSSRGLQLEWRESMMRILHVRPRVCRKRSPAPPTPSPPSGTEIEELSTLIARKEAINNQIIRVLRKENKLLRNQTQQKTRKRKIRGGL